MPKFPSQGIHAPLYLSTLSGTSAASATLGAISTVSSLTWVANLAVYIPIVLPTPYPARRLFTINGTSSTAQNQDVGIYTEDGVLLVSAGSTAKSGSALQYYSPAALPLLLPPGRYYLGYANGSATTLAVRGTAAAVDILRISGVLEQASAFPLPATMTPAAIAHALYPYVGFTQTT